jgi:hypothetical protein
LEKPPASLTIPAIFGQFSTQGSKHMGPLKALLMLGVKSPFDSCEKTLRVKRRPPSYHINGDLFFFDLVNQPIAYGMQLDLVMLLVAFYSCSIDMGSFKPTVQM